MQIHNMPREASNEDAARTLGQKLGEIIKTDMPIVERKVVRAFLRLMIRIDLLIR